MSQGRTATIAKHECDHRGEIPTSAVAGHRQSIAEDVQLVTMSGEPADHGVGVLTGRRELVFRCQPVVDRHDPHATSIRQFPAEVVVAIKSSQDELLPLCKEDERGRLRPRVELGVDAHGEVAIRSG